MISQLETTKAAAQIEVQETVKKEQNLGKTIGKPQLSEEGQKYYEELKKKYGNMDFILVSNDMKEIAKAQAGKYANANKMVVLIDEEKIERMAADENYRKKYEAIISNAGNKLTQIKNSLGSAASSVKAFGMQVQDNRASFFAVMDKSFAQQRERIAKKQEEKREAKKEAAKEAKKEKAEEAAQEKKEAKKAEEAALEKKLEEGKTSSREDIVVITASSVEELITKIQDMNYLWLSDNIQSEAELQVGQHIDFRG